MRREISAEWDRNRLRHHFEWTLCERLIALSIFLCWFHEFSAAEAKSPVNLGYSISGCADSSCQLGHNSSFTSPIHNDGKVSMEIPCRIKCSCFACNDAVTAISLHCLTSVFFRPSFFHSNAFRFCVCECVESQIDLRKLVKWWLAPPPATQKIARRVAEADAHKHIRCAICIVDKLFRNKRNDERFNYKSFVSMRYVNTEHT